MIFEVDEYVLQYYNIDLLSKLSIAEFQDFKNELDILEWDYPLDEYEHITSLYEENKDNFTIVKFTDGYRFCEIPN